MGHACILARRRPPRQTAIRPGLDGQPHPPADRFKIQPSPKLPYACAMRIPRSPVLLGAFAAALLAALGGAAWFALGPARVEAAGEALPAPPEPPRLSESAEYDRCLALLRADAEAARAMAAAWEAAGGGEAARHCGALALVPLGEPGIAAQQLEGLAARSRAGVAARAMLFGQAGQAWLTAGAPSRAFAALTQGLILAPADLEMLLDRAVASGLQGRFADALTDLDSAVETDARRADAWTLRAAALRHLDRAEEAQRDVERALSLDADNAEALLERGILRQLRGDTEGAREDWQRAITSAPESAAADLAMQNLALNEAGPQRR
jgi:tetratricopeptide (TPR) repeat protein